MVTRSGVTGEPFLSSVGNQYADASSWSWHEVGPPTSDCGVEWALVVELATYWWLCAAPTRPG
jgi:hypothetical protein